MLALRVEFLTGRYAATRFNDRNATEWPPHPARLFSAMVATWADGDPPDDDEREALLWFEALGAPQISVSEAHQRDPVTYFVPNNEPGSGVVKDLSKLYEKTVDAREALAHLELELAAHPGEPALAKQVAKVRRNLDKLRAKAITDAEKGAAAKAKESPDTVEGGLQLLPEQRGKQARSFPVVIPHDPRVHFGWPDADPTDDQRRLLDGILARVSRLGHSSSMVSCELVADMPPPTLVPGSDGGDQLRVTASGLLDELERAHLRHQGSEPRVLPQVVAAYRQPTPPDDVVRPLLGSEWQVLQFVASDTRSAERFPLRRALDLCVAVRAAILSHAESPYPEVLSGHQGEGSRQAPTPPSQRPHLAVVPLPFVGSTHADGLIRGIALVLPRDASLDERRALDTALAAWRASGGGALPLQMGRGGVAHLELVDQLTAPAALKARRWCQPSATWSSVTPVALDRVARGLWDVDSRRHDAAVAHAQETVQRACEHVGLPRPQVGLHKAGPLVGVPPVGRFPVYRSPGRKQTRRTVHVDLTFPEPVGGPVLLGAGRYFGYGLFLPTHPPASTVTPHVGSQAAS